MTGVQTCALPISVVKNKIEKTPLEGGRKSGPLGASLHCLSLARHHDVILPRHSPHRVGVLRSLGSWDGGLRRSHCEGRGTLLRWVGAMDYHGSSSRVAVVSWNRKKLKT